MISKTEKARDVRKYFIQLEKLVKRYFDIIRDNMYDQLGLYDNNRKPTPTINNGIIYIIKAENNKTHRKLFKVGESDRTVKNTSFKTRLSGYNSGLANNTDVLYMLKVNDSKNVEKCIKTAITKFQYRKRKEIYEIELNDLINVINKCDELHKYTEKIYTNYDVKMKTNIQNSKYYLYVDN